MKKFNLIFLLISIFLFFSCATTDTADEEQEEAIPVDEPAEETSDSSAEEFTEAPAEQIANVTEPSSTEEIAEEIFQEPVDQTPYVLSPNIPFLPRAQLPVFPMQPQIPLIQEPEEIAAEPETPQFIPDSPEIVEQPVITTPPVQTVVEQPLVVQPQVAQTPAPPAAQTPPAQTPSSADAPAQSLPSVVQLPPAAPEPPVKTDPVPNDPWSALPSAPSMRIESVTQMGMTPLDNEIIFSRIVRATVGQIVEIPFRGNGWVYLGEIASRRGIVYSSRRNDTEGLSFIFTLEEAGTYILKFYRQDFIRDYIINDHVQVIVGEAPAATAGWFNPSVDRGRVIAQPRWPSVLEEAQLQNGIRPNTEPVVSGYIPDTSSAQSALPQAAQTAAQSSAQTSSSQTPPSSADIFSAIQNASDPARANGTAQSGAASENQAVETSVIESPAVMLQRAKDSFDRGNVSSAISLLDQYLSYYPGGSDEAYWLMGQFYEANSPDRNILRSLEFYNKLINDYPQSSRFADARSRIAYLERFYINIR